MKCLVVCLFCALLCSCGGQKNEGIPVVDLSKTVGEIDLKLSDLLENIRLVPLETRPDVLLPGHFSTWVGEKYIVTLGEDAIHLFTVDGKYVRKLAQQGRGPEEYPYVISFCVDQQERYAYLASGVNYICVIDLEKGGIVRKISTGKDVPYRLCYSDKDSTLLYVPNIMKDSPDCDICRIALDGTLLHTVKNNSSYDWYASSYLWCMNDTIRYKMQYCDTLLGLVDTVMIPYCRFVTERPYSITTGYGKTINVLFENKDWLILNCDEVRNRKEGDVIHGFSKSCGNYVLDKSDFTLRKLKSFYLDIFDCKTDFIVNLLAGKRIGVEFNVLAFKGLLKDKLDNPLIPEYVKELYSRLNEEDNPVLLVGDVK